ncbi:16566_t:CDS:2, partial [Dentiscutata heterogama]
DEEEFEGFWSGKKCVSVSFQCGGYSRGTWTDGLFGPFQKRQDRPGPNTNRRTDSLFVPSYEIPDWPGHETDRKTVVLVGLINNANCVHVLNLIHQSNIAKIADYILSGLVMMLVDLFHQFQQFNASFTNSGEIILPASLIWTDGIFNPSQKRQDRHGPSI